MVGILSYGVGNTGSLINMLKRIGISSFLVSQASQIEQAGSLILPGVGSFDSVKDKLQKSGMVTKLISAVVEDQIPILGICVGMQILFESSEEGNSKGLELLEGKVIMIPASKEYKVPHVGWDEVEWNPNLVGSVSCDRFYFTHSYIVQPVEPAIILATCKYPELFAASVRKNNIWGSQFHPEKSHKNGMEFLKLFSQESKYL